MTRYYQSNLMVFIVNLMAWNVIEIPNYFYRPKVDLTSCMIIAVLNHYITLSLICNMISLGLLQYLMLKKVFFIIKSYTLKSSIISFSNSSMIFKNQLRIIQNFFLFKGMPLIPLIIILSINWRQYVGAKL